MNLQEAIEFMDNQGYYLIESTHAEDDTLDWLGQVVYEYTQQNGIEWESNWHRDGYKLVYRGIYYPGAAEHGKTDPQKDRPAREGGILHGGL